MVCEKCHKRPATVQFRYRINDEEKHYSLCQECYMEEQQKLQMDFGSMFENFFDQSFQAFPFNNLFQAFGENINGKDPNRKTMTQVQPPRRGGGFLDQFGKNLTDLAKAGKIDPVIGRDKEIRKVIEILNRRNKNNPVLIGEAGVGKTAIVEGLAAKIATGDVPLKLRNKEVYLLDVASLVANTGIRGQFEQRMKQLIQELEERKEVILFIDEIHLIVGAGSAEGSMDAGNILKPALARGEIQLIGATTLNEYRKIEKDPALERRFQPVHVQEPSVEDTIHILMGLKPKYEAFHHVTYTDEAIRKACILSHRYIQDRFLPDKAIDLLDEAGAKISLDAPNLSPQALDEQLQQLNRKKDEAIRKENYEEAAKLRDEIQRLEDQKKKFSNNVTPIVDEQVIYAILEEKTGIPVGKIQKDEQEKLKNLEATLQGKVIGQEEAIKQVARAIRRGRAGLKAKNRPIGSFLFIGPTGVGKTELAKVLTEELFGSRDAMIRLDMSEYMEKHSVSKLIGSPPGYVGYEEAGQLTEKVRRNPYSLILLDEIEKAHPDCMHIFLQILEDGRLTDSQGRTVSFKDTVIIMTSNAGTEYKTIKVGFGQKDHDTSKTLDQLKSYFKPEFLNRFDAIVEFKSLGHEELMKIVDLMLQELKEQLAETNTDITIPDEVKEKLVNLGYQPEFGARPLRRTIQEHLEDRIADFKLDHPDARHLIAFLEKDEIKIKQQ